MSTDIDKVATMAWYRVPEVWLILFLLGSSVAGSSALPGGAIHPPAPHTSVPTDGPRPSGTPPIRPAVADPPASSGDHGPPP